MEDDAGEVNAVLHARLADLRGERDGAQAAFNRARAEAATFIEVDPALVEAFGTATRVNPIDGTVAFRSASPVPW